MTTLDAVNLILRQRPELREQFEGHTAGEIVQSFARTFAAERRDALGVIEHERPRVTSAARPEAEPPPRRDPRCTCSNLPAHCQCAAAQYDPPDPAREAELIRQAARYGL